MTLRLFFFPILCFAGSLLFISCAPGYSIKLNTDHLVVDKTQGYSLISETQTILETEDGPEISVEKKTQNYTMTLVEKQPDGATHWNINFNHFISAKTGKDTTIIFDSKHPETEPDTLKRLIFEKISNATLRMHMLNNGVIAHISGMDEMWASVLDSMDAEKREMFSTNTKQFGDAFMAETLKNSGLFYPKKPIRKGKTWKSQSTIKIFNAQNNTTYQLKEVYANEYVVAFNSNIKNNPKAPGELKMGPATIYYYLSGNGKGETRLDSSTGLEISSQKTVEMKGKMEIKIPFLGTQAFPITIITSSQLKSLGSN